MGDLSEAVEVLEASDDRLEHLGALLALGSALRRAGQRAAARVPLREVLHVAFRGGAKALAPRTGAGSQVKNLPLRDDTGGLPLLDLSARGIESDGKHK